MSPSDQEYLNKLRQFMNLIKFRCTQSSFQRVFVNVMLSRRLKAQRIRTIFVLCHEMFYSLNKRNKDKNKVNTNFIICVIETLIIVCNQWQKNQSNNRLLSLVLWGPGQTTGFYIFISSSFSFHVLDFIYRDIICIDQDGKT